MPTLLVQEYIQILGDLLEVLHKAHTQVKVKTWMIKQINMIAITMVNKVFQSFLLQEMMALILAQYLPHQLQKIHLQ